MWKYHPYGRPLNLLNCAGNSINNIGILEIARKIIKTNGEPRKKEEKLRRKKSHRNP